MTTPERPQTVAYACIDELCGVATQINYRTTDGVLVGRQAVDSCPLCGGKVRPLTQAEYDSEYGDDDD